jgi:5-methylcytosine-specific restriction endonuclease McrA
MRVFRRDDYTCQHCGWRDETRTGEGLVCDHVDGIDLARGPFNIDELQTLCQPCSGKKDGPRATS